MKTTRFVLLFLTLVLPVFSWAEEAEDNDPKVGIREHRLLFVGSQNDAVIHLNVGDMLQIQPLYLSSDSAIFGG
jgi:hypothetical protein